MKRFCALLLLLALGFPARAQGVCADVPAPGDAKQASRSKVVWCYDVDFQYYFDNREFDASQSAVLPSMTLHSVVLAPTFGVQLWQGQRIITTMPVPNWRRESWTTACCSLG